MILLSDEANRIKKGGQELIGGLHITVNRNQFGGQVESFQANIKIPALEKVDPENKPFDCFFIRAPVVVSINDPSVEILATVKVQSKPHKNGEDKGFELGDELVVAIQQKHLLATSFHPELTKDHRWHQYFAHLIRTQSA
jgi:5'-phosphate synthase pdxT subunit